MIGLLQRKNTPAPIAERRFEPRYLLDEQAHANYIRDGYTVLKDCVDRADIEHMIQVYRQLSEMDGFELDEAFVNSGRFRSEEIRQFVVSEIKDVSRRIIASIADTSVCAPNVGGSFQIKPPSKKSALNPHQDTPIIDETAFYATYVWIPLCDMNVKNGTLCVLPGSHLWGNHQRSLNVPWIYEKQTKMLWKHMEPVEVALGDIICFDSAIIHSSMNNLTDEVRLAYTTALLPRDFELVHYYLDEETPDGMVEVFRVDEAFFYSCDIMSRPPEQYPRLRFEPWKGVDKVRRAQVADLIRRTRP